MQGVLLYKAYPFFCINKALLHLMKILPSKNNLDLIQEELPLLFPGRYHLSGSTILNHLIYHCQMTVLDVFHSFFSVSIIPNHQIHRQHKLKKCKINIWLFVLLSFLDISQDSHWNQHDLPTVLHIEKMILKMMFIKCYALIYVLYITAYVVMQTNGK